MKTALTSGMKNSLALVVKNGLSPMMKNALAGVTEGNSPRRKPRQDFPLSIFHFSLFICLAFLKVAGGGGNPNYWAALA
ncbi:MAG: hypothetical protein IJN29_00145 [Akkermansia sp.]|nr:hypothetical protein [Akkermansia sp.]